MSKLFNRLNVSLAAALLTATFFGFAMIPQGSPLPGHWDIYGVADRFAPREQILVVLPLGAAAMVALLAGIGWLIERKGNADVSRLLALSLSVTLAVFVAIQAMTVLVGMGHSVDVPRVTTIVSSLGLIALGNMLPKSRAKTHEWPESLNDPALRYRVVKVTGILMMSAGAVLFVAALTAASSRWLLALQIGCAVIPVVLGMLYALLARSRSQGG